MLYSKKFFRHLHMGDGSGHEFCSFKQSQGNNTAWLKQADWNSLKGHDSKLIVTFKSNLKI